jgi:hypothetical protein
LTKELDKRIHICLEQGIFGIDAVASCMSVAFNLLSKSVLLDEKSEQISIENYLKITYNLISQRTFSILLPEDTLAEIDEVSKMVLSAHVAVSDMDENHLETAQFNALCISSNLSATDVEEYFTIGSEGVTLNDLSSLKRMALAKRDTTRQQSLFEPIQAEREIKEQDEVIHDSNYMIDEMIHCMNLFENGTTALRSRLSEVDNLDHFQAYVQAFFQISKAGSDLRRLLEGVVQGF